MALPVHGHGTCLEVRATLESFGIHEKKELTCAEFSTGWRATVTFTHICEYYHSCKPSPYGYYHLMAKKFLDDLVRSPSLQGMSGAVLLVTQDDATLPADAVVRLRRAGTPLLAHSIQRSSASAAILIPDWHFIQHNGFEDLIRRLHNRSAEGSPAQPRPKVFWRGATTGWPCVALTNGTTQLPGPCTGCFGLQRVRLAKLLANASWADVKLSTACDFCQGADDKRALQADGLWGEKESELGWTKYRGVIDIDGHVNAWGLVHRLQSGSVVMRVESDQINAYILKLRPNVHYVPLAADLSDAAQITRQIRTRSPLELERFERMVSAAKNVVRRYTYANEVKRVAAELSHVWARHGNATQRTHTQRSRPFHDATQRGHTQRSWPIRNATQPQWAQSVLRSWTALG